MDMTKGNARTLLLKFSLPMILGNIFQQIYNLVDSIIVGKFIGADAFAAVGASFAIVVFLTSIIIGLTMGVGVLLAEFYGAKENEKFKEVVVTSFFTILISTFIIMFFSLTMMNYILKIFNIPAELLVQSKSYLTIIIWGLIFTFIYNMATAILRAIGDSKSALYFLIIASIINIVLDIIFVLKFDLAIIGVAVATVIAQGISAILSSIYVFRKVEFFKIKKEDIKISKNLFKVVMRYSLLTSLQQSIMNFGILIVQGLVNSFGAVAMAAFAVGVKVDSLAYMPVQDFGNAFATYVAQNKGANNLKRIEEGIKVSLKIIIGFCLVVSVLIFTFSCEIMNIFINSNELEVINLGVEYLSVVSIFYVLIGILFMLYGLFRGLGKLKISITLTVVSLGTRVVLGYILAETFLGVRGIWWAIPIGWILADILGFIYYKKYMCAANKLIKNN